MMRLLSLAGMMMLLLPGCFSQLIAPSTVPAILGTSVSVQCDYDKQYTGNKKYWCRGPGSSCRKMVETSGVAGIPVKTGRVSIEDNHLSHRFTVTIDDVRKDDLGAYSCGVTVLGREDLIAPVNITVTTRKPDDPDHTEHSSTSFPRGSIFVSSLIYVPILISIGLKIPIFLCLVFAIIWMHRRGTLMHSEGEDATPPHFGKTRHVLLD